MTQQVVVWCETQITSMMDGVVERHKVDMTLAWVVYVLFSSFFSPGLC
jgi:hypothetical protein